MNDKVEGLQVTFPAERQHVVAALDERLRSYADITRSPETATVGSDIQTLGIIVEDMDPKFRKYTEESKVSHSAILQEYEKEQGARVRKALNIRVAGLPKSTDEVTQDLVLDSFFRKDLRVLEPQIVSAVRVGRNDKGPQTILVHFASAECRTVVLSNRGALKGRKIRLDSDLTPGLSEAVIKGAEEVWAGSDVIALTETDGLQLKIEVENINTWKQFVGLRIDDGVHWFFLIVVYFAPSGATVYLDLDNTYTFSSLTQLVMRLRSKGALCVAGDFNARLGSFQINALSTVGDCGIHDEEDPGWERLSMDDGRNGLSSSFMHFVYVCGLSILNGVRRYSGTQEFTCFTPSLIDYVLASKDARERVQSFSLGQLSLESDHHPLLFTLSGLQIRRQKIKPHLPISLKLDYRLHKQYASYCSLCCSTRLRLLIVEFPNNKPPVVEPSLRQKNYADIPGIAPTKWEEDLSAIDISRMIEGQRVWTDDFHAANVDSCATGLQKEALRFRHICFDEITLTRQQALKIFIRNSGGIRLDQLKVLRHTLHVPSG
ncbi:hypothetical protein R1sor_007730 [Riccia sorocarpa]|uniref:Endonuclease/exonuclease/phosphatase domain-containing protein n=1 Tax=Riccia sorocarpa TaxID=122646 RepID=A0ABD3HUR7_9MARC